MNLFQFLWDAFSLESRSMQELIDLCTKIDAEKNAGGFLLGEKDELSQIACTVVALMNEKSISMVGNELYYKINELLVNKNLSFANTHNGQEVYEKAQAKDVPGTFKVRVTRAGCKFDLVAANGDVLATSEVYASMDSCLNGIASVKKNAESAIENQAHSDWIPVKNPKYEIYQGLGGEFRFRLKSRNGEVLLLSEGYKTPESCLTIIERVKTSAASNDIEKN